MIIFYDFETSSRDQLGQILGYSFVVTDSHFKVKDELTGWIKPNRTQCPEIDAILINHIDLRKLQSEGDSEYEAADKIYWFLEKHSERGPIMAGYNSNSFDLGFLRNLLIRNGRNPYFFGKIKNRDVLHWMRHLAFSHADVFPWQIETNDAGHQYYGFKLEGMARAFDCLGKPQTHDAREDVILTIDLVKAAEKRFKSKFADFTTTVFDGKPLQKAEFPLARQKVSVYPDHGDALQHFSTKYWAPLLAGKTDRVMVDVEKYLDEGAIPALRYFNLNKHTLIFEAPDPAELAIFQDALTQINEDPVLSTLTHERYFEIIEKKWDIEYQIHEMGIQRIDELRACIDSMVKNPDEYPIIIQQLIQKRNSSTEPDKDGYLIQLFNRFYLNNHPTPNSAYLMRYLEPRYVTGKLYRDLTDFAPFDSQYNRINELVTLPENEGNSVISGLKWYFDSFYTLIHPQER